MSDGLLRDFAFSLFKVYPEFGGTLPVVLHSVNCNAF